MSRARLIVMVCFLTVPLSGVYALQNTVPFYPWSVSDAENYIPVPVSRVTVHGNNILPDEKILKMVPFPVPGNPKMIQVLFLEQQLINSGYFAKVTVRLERDKNGYASVIKVQVVENRRISNIYYKGNYAADITVLEKLLMNNGLKAGLIFNSIRMKDALQSFRDYLQKNGRFFFQISGRRITDRYGNESVEITLVKLDKIFIREIRLSGNRHVMDKAILNELLFQPGQTVTDERILAVSLWKLRKLGIFKYVYFDIAPFGNDEVVLTVQMTEIQSEEINTSISLNSKNRFNFDIDYFDYSVGERLGRISCGIIMNFVNESLDFIAMYSLPRLKRDYFFNIKLEKSTATAPYISGWEQYIERYSVDITLGRRLSRFFSVHGILNGIRTRIFYAASDRDDSDLPEALQGDDIFLNQTGKVMFMLDMLDDNFFPTKGIRTYLTWTTSLINENRNFHQLDYKLEFYWPLLNRITFSFYGHASMLFTDDLLLTLPLEENRRTTAQDYTAMGLQQKKMNLYGIIEFRWRFLEEYSIGAFGEAAAAWLQPEDFDIFDLGYGIGLSFRMAPREHYSAHIIKYPWSVNIGFNISDRHDKKPLISMLSSRDEYYYINLQASF